MTPLVLLLWDRTASEMLHTTFLLHAWRRGASCSASAAGRTTAVHTGMSVPRTHVSARKLVHTFVHAQLLPENNQHGTHTRDACDASPQLPGQRSQ